MSHLRRTAIPNSWDDDDDWGVPAATTSAPSPPVILASSRAPASSSSFPINDAPVVITSSQQPKTFYKPEITLLKRSSPSATPEPKPSSNSSSSSFRNEEKERIERERKEKERRYQEAKDRIFASSSTSTSSTPEKGKGKKSGRNTPKKASPTPPPLPPPVEKPARNSNDAPKPKLTPPPQSTGAITGFSLNSGSFGAAPVKARERDAWQLRQVALDGKMLESQAQQYGFGRDEELLGDKERGLDWDEFRRDRWEGGPEDEISGRLDRLEFVEVGESADEPAAPRRPAQSGVITPVREPRGPEGEGRGFGGGGGRGRGSGRRGASS